MPKPLRKARTLVVAGLAAGALTLAAPSPAGAVGARPEDPTTIPEPTVPPLPAEPLPGAPGPTPPPPPAPPAPAPAPAPRPKVQIEDATTLPEPTVPPAIPGTP